MTSIQGIATLLSAYSMPLIVGLGLYSSAVVVAPQQVKGVMHPLVRLLIMGVLSVILLAGDRNLSLVAGVAAMITLSSVSQGDIEKELSNLLQHVSSSIEDVADNFGLGFLSGDEVAEAAPLAISSAPAATAQDVPITPADRGLQGPRGLQGAGEVNAAVF